MTKNTPGAEAVTAPDTENRVTPQYGPRNMQLERQGAKSVPYTRKFPQVRGGTCEKCGVLDPNVPAQFQYKLCEHYRGLQLRCSYCDELADPDDVVYHAVMNVAEHPHRPNTIIAWCNSYECSRKHLERSW